MSFTDNIKKWVNIDDEIKTLYNNLKCKREERNEILQAIIKYKNENNLDNKMIKYNDQMFQFSKQRQYQNITYNFISTCLNEILDDTEKVDYIINYIKEKRQFKNIEDIKRLCI